MGRDVALSPGVVVDASSGPVNIEAGVKVMANAGLCGPLHLGANAIIKMGATIYGGTSVGQVSKVGGEVAESIVAGYSNKQHQGFLGHSYLGEWVNIGAGTDTSDMKNNYSTVRVRVAGKLADSGRLFLGLVMGDHSKSGIGTTFGAGTTVGVCSNIFGAGYPPKDVPSFAWGGASQFVEHRLAAALETARRVMARRGVTLGGTGEEILRAVFTSTADERGVFLRR
jgi:UDP-N-acetylglucosamine diphosphorylase/glucosamine-1-phosphate N-acetyltransferase